jgi:hypothetical protein
LPQSISAHLVVRYGGFVMTACLLSKKVLFLEESFPAGLPVSCVEAKKTDQSGSITPLVTTSRLAILVVEETSAKGVTN